MKPKPRTLRKEVFLPHPPEDVWLALTDPQALAEWLMPNNFEPVAGRKFRFHVDPMPGPYPGGSECEVLEVEVPLAAVLNEHRLGTHDQETPSQGASQCEGRPVHTGSCP